tara:strand:+ start:394 stop:510 length:117 start_codon:yes stop_codon:yes gene_type:complete
MNNVENDFNELQKSLGCGSILLFILITFIFVAIYNLIF